MDAPWSLRQQPSLFEKRANNVIISPYTSSMIIR
jgi:hypothetical protein